MSPECGSSGKARLSVNKGFTPPGLEEVTRADFSEKILWLPRPTESSLALHEAHVHWNSLPTPTSRLPAGGKAVNTAPVPGQTPHDESDRRTEPRSSVSDLVSHFFPLPSFLTSRALSLVGYEELLIFLPPLPTC